MPLYEFENKRPAIGSDTFVHPQAVLIGAVSLGRGCYVGAGAVLRADWGKIVVSDGSNIQENCVVHLLPDGAVTMGPASHIGHGAVLHNCRLGTHVLVGMGAILQDHVSVGDRAVIGVGSVLKAEMEVPPGKLVVGVPARIIGDVSPALKARSEWGTKIYQGLPERCRTGMRQIE